MTTNTPQLKPAKTITVDDVLSKISLSDSAQNILRAAPSVTFASSVDELVQASVPADKVSPDGYFTVAYDVPGRGEVEELKVCRVKNGISANYVEPYMRRRDAECMVIGDQGQTDKPTYEQRFDQPFEPVRQETFEWLKTQDLAVLFFNAGQLDHTLPGIAIAPANAGFFALGLAMLQGIVPVEEIMAMGDKYWHEAIVYVAPPFRHTHFEGKQIVVHNRREELHELFSYNLYPGPSAKKGIYGMLLNLGERDDFVTAHCSTVRVTTPYDNATVFMHEGASGGGKSEMLEHMHREADGRLRMGTNTVTGESRYLALARGCKLEPVTDDMALCHYDHDLNTPGQHKLTVSDAEDAWFLRVNHITNYGKDPHLEGVTVHPSEPLLFLNIDAKPEATALIWEHIMDEPGKPCPNPRLVMPRQAMPGIVNDQVEVDVRSFGVRCPPCTKENPTYGIMGMFHVLPPSLAWLWRLVAPRGHANPSIVETGGMTSEGVGSYWPFATGRKVDQANLILRQILGTPDTMFVLMPNQHVGCWETGFSPQWITREYLARRGATAFAPEHLLDSPCPLLGRTRSTIQVEGMQIGHWFLQVETQPEVGMEGFKAGEKVLTDFFHQQIKEFQHPDLDKKGQEIIQACLDGASISDYDGMGY
ncbi:MAG: DUF4914 family protein [Planctomycetota bacterium]